VGVVEIVYEYIGNEPPTELALVKEHPKQRDVWQTIAQRGQEIKREKKNKAVSQRVWPWIAPNVPGEETYVDLRGLVQESCLEIFRRMARLRNVHSGFAVTPDANTAFDFRHMIASYLLFFPFLEDILYNGAILSALCATTNELGAGAEDGASPTTFGAEEDVATLTVS